MATIYCQFESTDLKIFDDTYEKKLKAKGFQKGIATDILRASTSIRGLENASRSFVRDIYAAKRGEVLKPERVDNSYVVAVVTEALEEGTMSTARARAAGAETEVRVKKKGELLKKKIGTVTTLEDAIAKLGGLKQIEPIDSLYGSNLSYEPKVIGAAFNPANKGKVVPEVLVGKQGVYVIRVEDQSSIAVPAEDINAVRQSRYQQAKQSLGNQYSQNNPLTILRNAADIKDKRSERF